MLILSSPSGAGKSSLARALVEKDLFTKLSVSTTTRRKRPGEVEAKDYYFVSDEKFNQLIKDRAFIEHAGVFGNRYGTLVSEVIPYLAKGIDVVFDVDWQGARALRSQQINNTLCIYILPPSTEELRIRLLKRMQDDIDTIDKRMQHAMDEMSHQDEYDYIVINDHFEDALSEIKSILQAERMKLRSID